MAGKMNWIKMTDKEPPEGEVLFVANSEKTNERIGWAIPENRYIVLHRTDISFDDVYYWIAIPEIPQPK